MWTNFVRVVIDAARRLFGGNRSESSPATAPTQIITAPASTITPEVVPKLVSEIDGPLYDKDQVSRLGFLSFEDYGNAVAHLARAIEMKYKIPYIVPIVQSAHESRNGNSGLARKGMNLFGITSEPGDKWRNAGNPIITMSTNEFINGAWVQPRRGFRSYPNWFASFTDWAKLISTLGAYKKAFALFQTGDAGVEQGINEMARAYATDPKYAAKVVALYRSVKAWKPKSTPHT